jgi:chromosomal replication initiator protein
VQTSQGDQLWQTILGNIEISLSHANFVTWFSRTHVVKHADGQLVIGVPNIFFKNQLEKKYSASIADMIKTNSLPLKEVVFKIHTQPSASAKLATKTAAPSSSSMSPPQGASLAPTMQTPSSKNALTHQYRQGLNERYTFENFVVGAGNELAYAACQAVAAEIGTKYNPLFLYGGVGIGKTHLIQAVGNAVLARTPNARVVYISSEQFVQEFVDALRFKKTPPLPATTVVPTCLLSTMYSFLPAKKKSRKSFFTPLTPCTRQTNK